MGISFISKAIKCGNDHTSIIEQPPGLAIRQHYNWGQKGNIEIFGGRKGRPLLLYCWLHDISFTTVKKVDDYLIELDRLAGAFGKLTVTLPLADNSTLSRDNCRFIGARRVPFNGQMSPEPIPASGVPANYGAYHIAAELHFYQLNVE